jgi:type I restriction-modification system DNA methylase subunit
MSGVQRTQSRIKATGEVFTPTELVCEILEKMPIDQFTDSTKTFLDPSCGDGQFLGEVIIRKMENGSTFEQALQTVYGVDLMQDNVDLCRERLLCGRTDLAHIVKRNIVCHDALAYDYSFNGTDLTDQELLAQNLGIPEVTKVKVTKPKKIKKTPIDISALTC